MAAYAGAIFPVPDPDEWTVPEDIRNMIVLPPPWRLQAGRPRKKRIPSAGEISGRVLKCSHCGQKGHYRQNCRNPHPSQRPPMNNSEASVTQVRRQRKCRTCHQVGHNSKTCKNALRPTVPEQCQQ